MHGLSLPRLATDGHSWAAAEALDLPGSWVGICSVHSFGILPAKLRRPQSYQRTKPTPMQVLIQEDQGPSAGPGERGLQVVRDPPHALPAGSTLC